MIISVTDMNKTFTPKTIQFGILSEAEIIALSVCQITKPSSQGAIDKNPMNTPYDPRLGRLENGMPCATCRLTNKDCPGHMGYIKLPIPVYSRLTDWIMKILHCVCIKCSSPRIPREKAELLGLTKLDPLKRLAEFVKKGKTMDFCPNVECGAPLFNFKYHRDKITRFTKKWTTGKATACTFSAGEAYTVFIGITNDTCDLLGFNNSLLRDDIFSNTRYIEDSRKFHVHQFRPESLIFTVFPVSSPFIRPYVVKDGKRDDDITDKLNSIIKHCNKLELDDNYDITSSNKREKLTEPARRKIELELRNHIWSLINNKDEGSKLSTGGRPHKCITSRIDYKHGRMQGNVIGKRVDQAARGVIVGGGVLLKYDELGVPEEVANELTKEEYVRVWNIEYLSKLVSQGNVNRVERNGNIKRLDLLPDKGVKFKLQVGDRIERKLQNGDVGVFNRQPTIRDENMIAFKARIIRGRAFRLGECFTKGFNADFDGDEMNLHIPQSKAAICDAIYCMNAAGHLVTSQTNSPINGLIQDSLVAVYKLTNTWDSAPFEETMSVGTFMNLVTQLGIDEDRYKNFIKRAGEMYPECIQRGKFIVNRIGGKLAYSILFPHDFYFIKKTETNPVFDAVIIENGIMVSKSGPLCKNSVNGGGSIIHRLWKEYSPKRSLEFVSESQTFLNYWLPTAGFSMGISDCITTSRDTIHKVICEVQAKAYALISEAIVEKDGCIDKNTEMEVIAMLNSAMNKVGKIADTDMEKGMRNSLNIMRTSGAKGSIMNLIQIVAFVGQQNIEGGRVPFTLDKRALPHYEKNDNSPEARGMVYNNYISGLNPQEYFFHAQGGREGLISTAIKTSTTGYIQKKMARKMEDLKVCIDGSVRKHTGQIVQFMYGDDGMNAKHLVRVKGVPFPFFCNPYHIARRLNGNTKTGKRHLRDCEIDMVCSILFPSITRIDNPIHNMVKNNNIEQLTKLLQDIEIVEKKIPEFIRSIRDTYEFSKAAYGYAPGFVATTSINAHTMQMTLNVFHFAGMKGSDISVGIPRLEQVIGATKSEKQKNPHCTIYLGSFEGDDETIMDMLHERKTLYEETRMNTFIEKFGMNYIPSDIPVEKRTSPVDMIEYKEHKLSWWEELYMEMDDTLHYPECWVIVFHLSLDKLFKYKITVEQIAKKIQEVSDGKYTCIPSPNNIGQIVVYGNFDEMKNFVYSKKTKPIEVSDGTRSSILTQENLDFFTCREILVKYISSIHISGIEGIVEVNPRKLMNDEGWVFDAKCKSVKLKQSEKRFINILGMNDTEFSKTMTDDMHAIKNVLGIEAARNFLFREIKRIISFNGSYTDPRHIQILVDSMTCDGIITPVKSMGISRKTGPCTKMAFEQTVENATISSIICENDPMESVSSSIMFGAPAKVGTGAVVVRDMNKMPVAPVKCVPQVQSKITFDKQIFKNERRKYLPGARKPIKIQ